MERLRSLREKSGLTQGEAAKKMGIVRTTYSNYEAGNREPDLGTLKKMAEFFEVSTDYLLGNEKPINMNEQNDANTTISLIEKEAEKLGLRVTDPRFQELLSKAFEMLDIARGKDEK